MSKEKQKQKAPKRKLGRPTKFTPETRELILQALRGGNYREVAAEWAGVEPETVCRWLARDEEPYRQFRQAMLEAERSAEIRMVVRTMKAADEDPKHGQWWLERKFPDRWGRKDRHELTGKDGGVIDSKLIIKIVKTSE